MSVPSLLKVLYYLPNTILAYMLYGTRCDSKINNL